MATMKTRDKGKSTHLAHPTDFTLCGEDIESSDDQEWECIEDATLTCVHCASIALVAIAGTTKKERKLWRELK